jgi:DNA polymerase III alpha subunit (gram-positive type)
LAGHFVEYDRRFLEASFRRAKLKPPTVDPRHLDTAQLAWPLYATGRVGSLALESVCGALGITYSRPCRAEKEAQASFLVARRLLWGLDLALDLTRHG